MKLYIEDNEARPAYVMQRDTSPAPAGFTPTDDISLWDSRIGREDWDYKTIRDAIKALVMTAGGGDADVAFAAYPDALKNLCVKHKIASDAARLAFAGADALVEAGNAYNTRMFAARQVRANRVTSEISNRLPAQRFAVLSASQTVFRNYIEYGIEGTLYGDPVAGAADYVMGTSSFAGAGLIDSGYSPAGQALPDFCASLISILCGDGGPL